MSNYGQTYLLTGDSTPKTIWLIKLAFKVIVFALHSISVGICISLFGEVGVMVACTIAAIMTGLSLTAVVARSDAYVNKYAIVNAGLCLILGLCAMSFYVNPASLAAFGIGLDLPSIFYGGSLLYFFGSFIGFKVFRDFNRCIDEAKEPGDSDLINDAMKFSMDSMIFLYDWR